MGSKNDTNDALSAVQPFVDSVIKSLVSEYEDKLSSKQEYLDRLIREAQDARELNEALSSQCVPHHDPVGIPPHVHAPYTRAHRAGVLARGWHPSPNG